MEEEDSFIPNLATMLEVSLVEDADAVLSQGEVREPTEICGEAKTNAISVNGVTPSDAESRTEAKVTEVPCHPVAEQNEIRSGHQELLPSGKDVDEDAKRLFYLNLKDTTMVMYLRLHCTVCDCHIGCAPVAAFTMAVHKFLRVLICKDCETFYGNGEFVCGDDGSETFCHWCGQGGHLYCCSICPTVFCKKCIGRNLGKRAVKVIAVSDDWVCYRCNLHPLREHRALCWGLSTFLEEQSKGGKKIHEDEAQKSPGFNPLMCCQGEKLPYYRASNPLRPILFNSARKTLNVKDIKTLTLETNETNILRNTLISGGKAMFTTPSTVTKTSSETSSIPVIATANLSQPVGVVARQVPSTGKQFMSVKSPTVNNVSDATVKLPAPKATVVSDVSDRNTALCVLQKQPQLTYENAFLSHLAKTGVQSGTLHQNQTPGQNTALTVTSHINVSTPANLEASIPLTYIRSPLRAVLLSPTPNSNAGPTVNKVFLNQNNNSGSVIYTVSPVRMGATQHLQHNAVTPVPTTYCTIMSNDPPKLVPLPRFSNTSFPASRPDQFTCAPPHPKNVVGESAIEIKTAALSVNDGNDDNDIVEVFSNVQDSNVQKVECQWMMETFRRVNCTSRVFLYHTDILRQKFEKERSAEGRSHVIGKFYRLLKRLLKILNVQKEYVSKEFSDWLNAEEAKHGLPIHEGGQNSSSAKGGGSDAEITQDPDLLLDMEITCESDHEDVSEPIAKVQQNVIGCSENLSDSDSDSDDPFDNCESNKPEKVIPVLKPILSHTVREVLRDKCTRKLLLQLLTEHDSKTANTKSKIISFTEGIQSADGREESSVKEKECEITKLKKHVSTVVLTGETSANCDDFAFSAPKHVPCSGAEKEKTLRAEAIASNGKAVQGSQMGTTTSGTAGKARNEESERNKSPFKNSVGKSVDANSEVVQVSQMGTSASGIEGKARNEESERCKCPCKNSVGKSADADRQVVQGTQVETSSSGAEGKAGNEESESSKFPFKSSVGKFVDAKIEVLHDSQMETSSSGTEGKAGNEESERNKFPCKSSVGKPVDANSEVLQDSEMRASSSVTEGTAANKESERGRSVCRNKVAKSIDANSEAIQDSQMETSSSGIQGKTINAKCDKSNQKNQATKRKCHFVSHTVASSDRGTKKRFRTGRGAALVQGKLQRAANPVTPTDFAALVDSAVQKKLIKPCFVSVVKLNTTD